MRVAAAYIWNRFNLLFWGVLVGVIIRMKWTICEGLQSTVISFYPEIDELMVGIIADSCNFLLVLSGQHHLTTGCFYSLLWRQINPQHLSLRQVVTRRILKCWLWIYSCVYYCRLGSLPRRSSQCAFLAVIFPFSKSEREGKRGSTIPGGYWALSVNPRFHVLFQKCRQGQNDADKATKMFTIDLFSTNFIPLGCEGSRGSHPTTKPFMKTKTAAADRPRAGMPAPVSHT